MSNFIWVRNPTIINGLATTYVSKRGSDTTGDGTAQNPYASLAKATSVANSGTNIMIDDGVWNESRTLNNKSFVWFGNSKTIYGTLENIASLEKKTYMCYSDDIWNYIYYFNAWYPTGTLTTNKCSFYNSILFQVENNHYTTTVHLYNCIIIKCNIWYLYGKNYFYNCILLDNTIKASQDCVLTNCIIKSSSVYDGSNNFSNYNNYTSGNIPSTGNINSINNSNTGQTFADYFNYYDPNDWLKCDFTAKDGSKNIGAGEKGTTIGLNQGYTARADNSANDIFSAANGATVRNCAYSSSLNGYILEQVDRVCAGATSNTITFDADASSQSGYYIGLFVGITAGVGENQIRYITDYNGATKTATVSQAWDTIPDTESEYTISGKIDSAVKDFGKAIKVKRNFTFVDNMTALANGQWAEFLTAATAQNEMQPVSCFKWEYSVDGLTWRSGTELISATDGNNYVDNFTIGDASAQYNEAEAEFSVFRYVRFHIHIGFNIDNLAEA